MKQSPTECVPSASEILPWQIVWCFLWGYEGMQRDEEGIMHRNPAAKGTLGQVTCCGAAGWRCSLPGNLPYWGAGKVLGFLKSSPALWSPASPCCKQVQGHITREPGLCVTNPAPEPISAWDWQGSSWLLEQHLYPSGEESSALLSSFHPGFDKNNLRKFTFSFVQILYFLVLEQLSCLADLSFCSGLWHLSCGYKASFIVLALALK